MRGPVLLSLVLMIIQVDPSAGRWQEDDPAKAIKRIVAPYVSRGDFAGVAGFDRPGAEVRVAFGLADRVFDVSNQRDTRFGIGSITKQFTAALILRFVEAGSLGLSDTVSQHLPELTGPPVTVHQLLAHRSGLARDPFSYEEQSEAFSPAEMLEVINGHPREFPPGERTSYSNSGFVVLALLAERIAGRPFCDVLRDSVLLPVGLHDTGCLSSSRIIPRLARGYDPGPGPSRLQPSPWRRWSNVMGAGVLYSTVDDLVKWGHTMLRRDFLSGDSWERMLADYGDGRGYGFASYQRHGHLAIGHDGVINGYTAFLEVFPADSTVVAYAGNIRSGAFEIMEGALTAIALNLSPEVAPPPNDVDQPISAEQAGPLVGRYELFPGFHLDISFEDQRLHLSGTGGYPTVLTSGPDGRFFYRAMYAWIRFDPEREGSELIWIDRFGEEYPARRIASQRTPRS